MKKIIVLSVALIFSSSYLMAQEEDVIGLYLSQKQYEKAKEEVDSWLAKPTLKDRDKATAYLWKLTVYSQLYAEPSFSRKYPNADKEAMDAFYQYQAMDPKLKQLKEQNFAGGIGNIYATSFEKGKNHFQAKQWDNAYKYFAQAENLGNFFLANKLSSSSATIDTITVLYTGYAAQNAQKFDSAVKYYSKLADIAVDGPDYEDIYKFLLEYNLQQKNTSDFTKYLALAKELYPNDNAVWTAYEMSNMTTNSSLMELLRKYQQDVAAGNMSEEKLIGYAEAFATTDKTQLNALDSTQKIALKKAAAEAFAKAFELNNINGLYAFNTGVLYYGFFGELDDRYSSYRGRSAKSKTKRAEALTEQVAFADTAAFWLEEAYPILKGKANRTKSETKSLNRMVDYLANIYYWKREQTKTNGNRNDYTKFDMLYKKYDAEHDTYKEGIQNREQVNDYSDVSLQNSPLQNVYGKGKIKLVKKDGVYYLNVIVNDELSWEMIFDTGASDVSISKTEALYMLKHGSLMLDDITGQASYKNADGQISTGTTIILKKIDLGRGIILYNVRASIVESLNAPLLLGQSALEQFNTITFDKANSLLIVN